MVEGTGFENQQVRKGLEGSTPSLSARAKYRRKAVILLGGEERSV